MMTSLNSEIFDISNDSVVKYIRSNREGCRFMLDCAKKSFGTKFYEPSPPSIYLNNYVYINVDDTIDLVTSDMTDKRLMKIIGKDKFEFVRFVLLNSLLKVEESTYVSQEELEAHGIGDSKVFKVSDGSDTVYENVSYLFHGSVGDRWYSIIMNGLKVLSCTPDALNGSAYGRGIYLSDSAGLSCYYSRGILGIFEVEGDVSKYNKGRSVFVVPTGVAKLRYILVTNFKINVYNRNHQKITAFFDHKFATRLGTIKKCQGKIINSMSNRRLMKEAIRIPRIKKETGIIITIPDDSNMFLWKCKFPLECIGIDTELYSDMKRYKVSHVELEIKFPDKYPIHPPFIRIVSPRMKHMTGHITSGGSVCMEILTCSSEGGWSPSITMENLMITIKALLIEGGGRIEGKSEYSLKEAEESFKRMVLAHGWK